MLRQFMLAVAVALLAACGEIVAPRPQIPAGSVQPTSTQEAALRSAFDSVGRCLGDIRLRAGRPAMPAFYIVAGADSFVASGGRWASGEYLPGRHAIVIAEREMDLHDAPADHPERAFHYRLWMHEAMHAYVYYYAGFMGHPAGWFGSRAPCGTLNPWWDGAWTPAPARRPARSP